MSSVRVSVLSLCVLFVFVGLLNGRERVGASVGEPATKSLLDNPVVFGGIELCGPIYESFMLVGPKDDSGKLDPSQIEPSPHLSGLFRAEFTPDPDAGVEISGFAATSVTLGDFKGNTQTLIATWDLGVEDGRIISAGITEEMRRDYGEPVDQGDAFSEWEAGLLRVILETEAGTGEVDLFFQCLPTFAEFRERADSAPDPEEVLETVGSSEENRPSEKLLGIPLLAILAGNGEPTVEPYRKGERILGLYYEDHDFAGAPCRMWVWFVDGETVYKGFKFAPPLGPKKAVGTFTVYSEALSEWYGEPFTHIGGAGFDRIKDSWLNGSEQTTLRLEMADEYPWMSLEITHREKAKEVGSDFRPGGKPIPRYVPPPQDSGKTRGELAGASARG